MRCVSARHHLDSAKIWNVRKFYKDTFYFRKKEATTPRSGGVIAFGQLLFYKPVLLIITQSNRVGERRVRVKTPNFSLSVYLSSKIPVHRLFVLCIVLSKNRDKEFLLDLYDLQMEHDHSKYGKKH